MGFFCCHPERSEGSFCQRKGCFAMFSMTTLLLTADFLVSLSPRDVRQADAGICGGAP
jgi:hypothetical protein